MGEKVAGLNTVDRILVGSHQFALFVRQNPYPMSEMTIYRQPGRR